jgi:hypothetical protein
MKVSAALEEPYEVPSVVVAAAVVVSSSAVRIEMREQSFQQLYDDLRHVLLIS